MFLLQKTNPRKFQSILWGAGGSMDISLNCTLFFKQPANFQMGGELKLKPLEGAHTVFSEKVDWALIEKWELLDDWKYM